jgi:hypothetical protein
MRERGLIMRISCKNLRCKHYGFCGFGGWQCIKDIIYIDDKGKCSTYEKDTLENYKLAKENKYKKDSNK